MIFLNKRSNGLTMQINFPSLLYIYIYINIYIQKGYMIFIFSIFLTIAVVIVVLFEYPIFLLCFHS